LSEAEFASIDPDKDGTLSKHEYLKLVENRFKPADPDNDGTLDDRSMKPIISTAGIASSLTGSSQEHPDGPFLVGI
jgi:Ca2+-binding EF-hand superfamily protein